MPPRRRTLRRYRVKRRLLRLADLERLTTHFPRLFFFNLTPAPPPFSAMNSTPAFSRAAMILPAVSARPPISLAVMSELRRLPLSTLIAVTWRLKLARLFLWLARVTDRYEGVDMRTARRIVESAEQCARKSDCLRRRLRP
jgi:hypothetical protein